MTPQLKTDPAGLDLRTAVDADALMQSPDMEERSACSPRKRRRFARLVSQDATPDEEESFFLEKSTTKVPSSHAASKEEESKPSSAAKTLLPMDLLSCSSNLKIHVNAIRLEADLLPMRLILSRLMAHQTHNRKGLFNKPVDPVALNLPDYNSIITNPMDLGTVKARLHAISYKSRDDSAEDIRLVFRNAIKYNPPHNFVHQCAAGLLSVFEESYSLLAPVLCTNNEREPISCEIASKESKPEAAIPAAASAAGVTELSSAPPLVAMGLPKRGRPKSSRLPPFLPHSCDSCRGRKCGVCKQGCLSHEPSSLACSGNHCGGTKIRKGAQYYITKDGQRQFCQKCFTSLPPLLPNMSDDDPCRYKKELLKRKSDEEIPEAWIDCTKCETGVHAVCAMHCDYLGSPKTFFCLDCRGDDDDSTQSNSIPMDTTEKVEGFTFVSGTELPVPTSSIGVHAGGNDLSADSLPECPISSFIQAKAQECMKNIPNAEKTIAVRVISSSSRYFDVPDVVRRHFRMESERDSLVKPPKKVHFDQKAIALFQKIDGLDVCIFCMYVQEYDGEDKYEDTLPNDVNASHSKRVYIAYIDSVEHFRPRECRTDVYHEILVSYLASARARGFDKAQIWACPPSRGNNFVFWNHPASQRTPTQERLDAWYHGVISRAVDCGVITDVRSLFESDFKGPRQQLDAEQQEQGEPAPCSGRMVCPPLLEGDFWIEEASRVHQVHTSRNLKVRSPTDVCVWNVTPLSCEQLDSCPAIQVATLLKDRIMTHPASVPFRRPVNAASLKLTNYHKIINNPMDLGTVYSRCVLGEYQTLREVVADVELTVANAKKFNPVGHFVHKQATEISDLFFHELGPLTKIWSASAGSTVASWESFADICMSLDCTIEMPSSQTEEPSPKSVVIEDDRSSDGSRSLGSSLSTPSSPATVDKTGSDEAEIACPAATTKKSSPKRQLKIIKPENLPRKLDLLVDGPDAVLQSMVGEDTWLLDKRGNGAPPTPKSPTSQKKGTKRRRRSSLSIESVAESCSIPKRRQSWLGEEVSDSVRKMRTSFFSCSLSPNTSMSDAEATKLRGFNDYIHGFDFSKSTVSVSSPITDARYALLEFSQFRHLEFDTLRRAKYSTAILLFHLHNKNAPGATPLCTSCKQDIEEVRWHKVRKAQMPRRASKCCGPRKPKPPPKEVGFVAEELCCGCHEQRSNQDLFIPIPVSMKLKQDT